MDFTDPSVFERLPAPTKYSGYDVILLPAGSTVYRADHEGARLPTKGIPNFFTDKVSLSPYKRGKGDEVVTAYNTTRELKLFVMSAANIDKIIAAGGPSLKRFFDMYYTRLETKSGSGEYVPVLRPSLSTNVTAAGKLLSYMNRDFANMVCKLTFDGWVALPKKVFQITLMTGKPQVVPYAPEIVICKWESDAKPVGEEPPVAKPATSPTEKRRLNDLRMKLAADASSVAEKTVRDNIPKGVPKPNMDDYVRRIIAEGTSPDAKGPGNPDINVKAYYAVLATILYDMFEDGDIALSPDVKKELMRIGPEWNKAFEASLSGGRRTKHWKTPRKMSRKYCKKTPCKKMGFTQRSSCRPYKNCFTRRARSV